MNDGVNNEAAEAASVSETASAPESAPVPVEHSVLVESVESAGSAVAAVDDTPAVASAAPESRPTPADERAPLPDDAVVESPVVHKHFTAPALIPLERLTDDTTFLVRGENELEDVSALATDIARLGQLFPIDVRLVPPDKFQVVAGFRRVAALRFLQRERVLARLHADLSDADALLMALASAIHSKSVTVEALSGLHERLESQGLLSAAARDMFEKALSEDSGLAPEQVEEEVDADELAGDVTVRLGQCNQDLSLLADVFGELDDEKKDELLRQLRYSADLVTFLEGKR